MNASRQIIRQLTILRILNDSIARITSDELVRRIEENGYRVTRRTIQRDLKDLLEAGFPIYSERRGRHIYWRIIPDTKLPPLPR